MTRPRFASLLLCLILGAACSASTAANRDGSAGPEGSDAGAGADNPPRPGKDFLCNEVIGLQATGQWYAAGFENDGVDGTHWQAKTQHQAYIEKWADPNNPVWDQEITSPCLAGSASPDRVVFVGFSPPSTSEAVWETWLTQDIATIQAKYPGVKEIDIMSMVRAPNNQVCPMNADTLVMIAPYIDQAIVAAVKKFPGLANVVPPIYVANCAAFVTDDTDLVPEGAAEVARRVAAAFAP